MKIRYSEIFYSLQGEGKFVGVPSIFLRTFGCNFQCRGFGMPLGELSDEKDKIDPSKYSKFEELPLVKTGCDSYASWDPRFKEFSNWVDVDHLVSELKNKIPSKRWTNPDTGRDTHLILTGGEPMLWQNFWPVLFTHSGMFGLQNVTFETNGTRYLSPEFKNSMAYLSKFNNLKINWSISPKLSASGEKWSVAVNPDVVRQYATVKNSEINFKFVVGNRTDVEEAEEALNEYKQGMVNEYKDYNVYLMPVGGLAQDYQAKMREIAELCLEKGYRFSPRLHSDIWGNAWGA